MSPVYEERISFWLVLGVFMPLTAIFIIILLFQVFIGPLGSKPAPSWFYLIMASIFLFFALAFSQYRLEIRSDFISAGFQIYRIKVPWDNIDGAEIFEGNLWKYGGYGIRVMKINGKKALAVAIPRTEIVRITLRKGKWDYLLLSTRNAEEVINHITQRTELHKKK